jgi:hypothetical protein
MQEMARSEQYIAISNVSSDMQEIIDSMPEHRIYRFAEWMETPYRSCGKTEWIRCYEPPGHVLGRLHHLFRKLYCV